MKDVKKGDTLQIDSSTWNAHNAVARWYQMNKPNDKPGNDVVRPDILVKCVSDSETVLPYGAAVVITPPTNLGMTAYNNTQALEASALDVVLCAASDGFAQIGVVYESPGTDGKTCGTIQTMGMSVVRVSATGWSSEHTHLRCGANGRMVSGRIGRHRVVGWLDGVDGDYDKWALAWLNGDLQDKADILIGEATVITADRKWEYAWKEQTFSSGVWTDTYDGMSDTVSGFAKARNRTEANNTSGGTVQGNGADFGAEPLVSQPDYIMRPIRGGAVAEARFYIASDGTVNAAFEANNAVQGPCA